MTRSESDFNQSFRELERLHEREKALVGYDLHDGIAQLIIGAKMNLEAVSREGLSVHDRQKVDDAKTYLSDAIVELRYLIGDLRASSIDSAAMTLELELLIDRYRDSSRIIDFYADENVAELPSAVCGAVYRIIQESLNNIKKHSHATSVKIILGRSDRRWQLFIVDNGIGIEPPRLATESNNQSFGLSGMQFRAAATGGTLNFFSKTVNHSTEISNSEEVNSAQRRPERPSLNLGTTPIYAMEQWLSEAGSPERRDQLGPDFVCGTAISIEWPNSP